MLAKPPSQALDQIMWPTDLVSYGRDFCGFAMPKLEGVQAISDIYKYDCGKPSISFRNKLTIAKNLCKVTASVHQAGYIIGDFNPNNIKIRKTGKVAFVDTDSYHVSDTYRCNAGFDGYIAPELLEICSKYQKDPFLTAKEKTFTEDTDNFALAIHIFQLLMNGYTPFNGIKVTERPSTASPGRGNEAVKRGSYCFKPGNKPMAANVPPISALPKDVADLFNRAFEAYDYINKRLTKPRPTGVEWLKALKLYQENLKQCSKNTSHQYHASLSSCPWCEADNKYLEALAPRTQKPVTPPTYPARTPSVATHQTGTTKTATTGTTYTYPTGTTHTSPLTPLTTTPSQPNSTKKTIWIGLALVSVIVLCYFFTVLNQMTGSFGSTNTTDNYNQSQSSDSNSGTTSQSSAPVSSGSSQVDEPPAVDVEATGYSESPIPGMLYSCDGTLPQQFKKNERVTVCTEQDRLIVRNHASPAAGELFRIYTGTVVIVLSGPECDGIASWWKIRVESGTRVYSPSKGAHYYLDHDVEGYVKGANQYGDPKEDVHLCNQ